MCSYGREEIKKLPPVTEAVRTTENKEEPPEVNIGMYMLLC